MTDKSKTFFETEIERIYGEDPLRPEHYTKVRQSKAYMEQCFSDNIELNDLAKAAFMSRFHYVRIFQRMYGLTPRTYLRDLRIAKAKTLIKQGLPITQVCLDVGYQSLPTFSSVFKKCTGYTPKEYQQLNKSNLK